MKLNRQTIAVAAAAPIVMAAWLLTPEGAQSQAAASSAIPCRVSWEDTTSGGDSFTVRGDAMLTQTAPQGNGSFVAIGNGEATVTFHPANSCEVTNGDTFTAPYMVTIESDDGRTAKVDISSTGESHEFKLLCPGLIRGRGVSKRAEMSSDYDAPDLPTVTVQLHEGATSFSDLQNGGRRAAGRPVGDTGTVTLHYCAQEQPGER
jgi:hypothetical protein